VSNELIPKSYWVIRKVYFTASPVDGFLKKYELWVKSEGELFTVEVAEFAEKIGRNDFIQLYQFPQDRVDVGYDYFEITDDNHVIPRCLFNLVENKEK